MSRRSVKLHEMLRWLNPFAKDRAEIWTPKTPHEIENALRPELYDLRWRHLPFDGYFGHLKPWGFVLERQSNQQPALTAKYAPISDGTRLDLTVGRSGRGLLSWIWNIVILPLVVVGNLVLLYEPGGAILSSLITIESVFQTAIAAFVVVWGPISIWRFLVTSYRHRDELSYYEQVLAKLIEAREMQPDQ